METTLMVTDCAFEDCDAKKMSFNIHGHHVFNAREKEIFEIFAVCQLCLRGMIYIVEPTNYKGVEGTLAGRSNELINHNAIIHGPRLLNQIKSTPCPDHVPPELAKIFEEGSRSFSIDCFNASVAMFRSCIDLATQKLLKELEKEPGWKAKNQLHNRIELLFKHGFLTPRLKSLAQCIKNDGDDAVHLGTIDKHEAERHVKFTELFLKDIYTHPKEIELAEQNTQERRESG